MTLKRELEILRGEPIKVFTGDPMDIPCIETSDPEKLCKHPVVSVHMITYNHEPYIRQAIEGVMMQKTDFEFELVIGEDASQDKTREICFEYQKKYPDKIRVLWWHENVSKLGGNEYRTRARCRGEFIAFCEGDDYWIDPLKLQKQVDVMRKYPEISFCCHQFEVLKNDTVTTWNEERVKKLMSRSEDGFGFKFTAVDFYNPGIFAQTAAVMYRCSMFDEDFYSRARFRCDIVLFYACLKGGCGYFINQTMSVYRIASTGVWQGKDDVAKARFHLRFAWAMYDADPCEVTKFVFDSAKDRLLNARFPLRQIRQMMKYWKVVISRLKLVIHNLIDLLFDAPKLLFIFCRVRKGVKFIHLIHQEKFTKPFVDFLNQNFDEKEHLVICHYDKAGAINPVPRGNNVVMVRRFFYRLWRYHSFVNYYNKSIRKIIVHSLFYSEIERYLSGHIGLALQKVYWMMWGGDLYSMKGIPAVRHNLAGIITDTDGDELVFADKYGPARKVYNAGYAFPITQEMINASKRREHNVLRVQINNSCDRSTLEVLDWLRRFSDEAIEIVVIHSYGDMCYRETVEKKGKRIFGAKFKVISNFMKPDEYAHHMAQNDILILNQNRQQGLGNCFAALALGVKLFIRAEISTFKHLNTKGCYVYRTEDIEKLSYDEFSFKNRKIIESNLINAKPFFDRRYLKRLWAKVFSD